MRFTGWFGSGHLPLIVMLEQRDPQTINKTINDKNNFGSLKVSIADCSQPGFCLCIQFYFVNNVHNISIDETLIYTRNTVKSLIVLVVSGFFSILDVMALYVSEPFKILENDIFKNLSLVKKKKYSFPFKPL